MDALPTGTMTQPQDSGQTQEAMDTQHTEEPDQPPNLNQDPDEMNICETDT